MASPQKKFQTQDLQNTLLCVHWLIEQFEEMGLQSIANIFRHALDDALCWIGNMSPADREEKKYQGDIAIQEARNIHDLLVKYAGIQDPERRQNVMQMVQDILKSSSN